MASKGGAVFLMVFGSIFLAVGAVMGVISLRTLREAEAMKRWTQTPAQILSCELERNRGSKGGYTYRIQATYQYTVGGASYTSDRVWLGSGSDNIGKFHQRTYDELRRTRDGVEAAETVCWVNPQNPSDAILIRTPRLEMLLFYQLFVLAFGGAGLGVVLAGLAALLQPSLPKETASAGQGQIRMRGASSHRVAGALALVWNGYAGWFLWQACHVMSPAPLPWWLWLMALTGAIPALLAGYLIGRFRKFGVSVFEMSPLPGVLGGPVSGTIRIPAKVETEDGFEVKLECVHQYTTGSGKQRTTHRDVLWEDSRHSGGSLSYGDETMLPVRFAVPYEKPATTVAGGSNGYYWQLKATAAAPGIDYKAVFDVPVRHTAQSGRTPEMSHEQVQVSGHEPVRTVIARERLSLETRADGGFELVFPAGRPRSAAVATAAIVAVWTAICAALWTVAKAPVVIRVGFTAFDVILIASLFQTLFVTRGVVVDRARQVYVTWWRALRFARRERTLPFSQILDARSERAGQSGNALYYRVVLTVDGGAPVSVGSGLTMWRDAENIAELLRAASKPAFSLDDLRV